jgi:phosphate transport system substrate-binding protein
MVRHSFTLTLTAIALTAALVTGCGPSPQPKPNGPTPGPGGTPMPMGGTPAAVSGLIKIDGSSTVYPISEAVAEEFSKVNPDVKVTAGFAGTGGGFKKLIAGEIDICDASRPITEKEIAACKEKGIEYLELQVAFDGLAVMVNPSNKLECITVAQLKKIWAPGSTVKNWNEVDPSWPDQPLSLYGAGTDSGTFDYFTEVINGKAKECRTDYNASEDDNQLATGIAGDKNALGFFGLAYYEANKDKIKLVAVDGGKGCVLPSIKTVLDGTYTPLSRPLFIYVNKKALARPEVKNFVTFYLENAEELSKSVGYVPVTKEIAAEMTQRLNEATK